MSTFLGVEVATNNISQRVDQFLSRESVNREIEYFRENIGSVETADDLLGDFRLYNFVLKAFDLDNRADQRGIFREVLSEPFSFGPGLPNPDNLANSFTDQGLQDLAATLDLGARGAAATNDPAVVEDIISRYATVSYEREQGERFTPGVEQALKFERLAPGIESGQEILADRDLTEVVRTVLRLPPEAFQGDPEQVGRFIESRIDLEQFQDPRQLERFIQRFAILNDLDSGGGAASPGSTALELLNSSPSSGDGPPPVISLSARTLETLLVG